MRIRTFQVKAMLNKKENAHLNKQLTITGLTKSNLLRSLIMKTNIQPAPSEKILETYRLVANLSNNANQIAKVANATGYIDSKNIDGLLVMVDKCWQSIKEIS